MDYQQSLKYLFEQLPMYHRIGAAAYKANLDNTIEICRLLGNPQDSFRTVHVAGTNGKGSVSHFLASIFQECGYKTGLYTSPHLKDFRERIRINGCMIPESDVIEFIEKNSKEFETVKPSFFEWTVGLAFDYFSNENVDIAIIETGLGGRLDSTNIILPELSVITNIGWDHSSLLGETLEKIAFEKAGVIKEKVPVLIGESQVHSKDIFMNQAKKKESDIYFADHTYKVLRSKQNLEAETFLELTLQRLSDTSDQLSSKNQTQIISSLSGSYQAKNIVTVMSAIDIMKLRGYRLNNEGILRGFSAVIRNTGIQGRWQKISEKPYVFCDTAHNEDGIKQVIVQLQNIHYKKLHIVFGMVDDKETLNILSLLPTEAVYYFCKALVPRAQDDKILVQKAGQVGLKGKAYGTVLNAFKAACEAAAAEDVIFVGGSTFVVAEVL